MSHWVETTIGELCDASGGSVKTGPFGSQLHQSDYQEFGIPFVMPADIINGKISERRVARVSEAHANRLKVHQLRIGDIIYGRRGDIGRQALIQPYQQGWLCGSGSMRLRLPASEVLPEYLHLYLSLREVVGWIEGQAIGATMPNLNSQILRRVPIKYPSSKDLQHKVVAVLAAYDDLIENNKRRIAILEKMAEEIYREWFVRLRFPGHETTKFEKGVPADWTIKTIGEICLKITDGSHGSPKEMDDGKFMASVKDMTPYGFSKDTMKRITDKDFASLVRSDCKPLPNDVLIAKDGSYLKHVFVWNHDFEVVILSSIAILRPNLDEILPYYLAMILKQDSTKTMMSGYVSGSALPRIILDDFKKVKLMLPPIDVIETFESVVQPFFDLIGMLIKQNELLVTTRDRLLPRLISGKLPVEDLDIQFPPSMRNEAEAVPME